MKIEVYATLRDIVGAKSIYLDDVTEMTIEQMLQALYVKYPALRAKLTGNRDELYPAINIMINGRDMRYINGLKTVVTSRDAVSIFPPVGGGI